MKNNLYICSPKTKGTGCSSVRLEYSSGGRVVAGSNPVTPTDSKVSALRQRLFCCPHVFCSRTFFHMYIAARLSVLADTGFLDACFSLGTGSGACARGEFAAVPGGAVRPGAMRVGRLASECRRPERGAGHCYSRGDVVLPVRRERTFYLTALYVPQFPAYVNTLPFISAAAPLGYALDNSAGEWYKKVGRFVSAGKTRAGRL